MVSCPSKHAKFCRLLLIGARSNHAGTEGEKYAERLVRAEFASGNVKHFEGEKGNERNVRAEFPSGSVVDLEGDNGLNEIHVNLTGDDGKDNFAIDDVSEDLKV